MSTLTKMSNNRETPGRRPALFMVLLTVWWFGHRRGLAVLRPGRADPDRVRARASAAAHAQAARRIAPVRCRPTSAAIPSGGVARLICVYGLIIYLVLRRLDLTRSKWAVGAWTVLARPPTPRPTRGCISASTGSATSSAGLVFGALLLVVLITATQLLDQPHPRPVGRDRPVPAGDAADGDDQAPEIRGEGTPWAAHRR